MAKATIINKSNATLHGLKPGGKLLVEVGHDGIPRDKNWRRRFIDSKTDGCVEIIEEKKESKPKKKEDKE